MSGRLKEVRERIKSVKSTQQITRAMKMVSASKLRKAQQAIVQMRPYADRLDKILKNILSNLEGDADTSFGKEREVKSAAFIIVTSNKGLCGAFNSNVIKSAKAKIDTEYLEIYEAGKLTILPIGKKGKEFFRKNYPKAHIINDHLEIMNSLTFEKVEAAASVVMDGFLNGTYDKVEVSYGRFQNAALQFPETVQFLPVIKMKGTKEVNDNVKADYIFEPDKHQLLEYLIPTILKTTVQKFVLDTHASEHGARMTAMDNATENAEEIIKELKISYNKARQEAITKELAEIVGGAAALEG